MSKWARGFITNFGRDCDLMVQAKQYLHIGLLSGVPIIIRDDATDADGRRLPKVLACYVDAGDRDEDIVRAMTARYWVWLKYYDHVRRQSLPDIPSTHVFAIPNCEKYTTNNQSA